jgi:hypothetical protein
MFHENSIKIWLDATSKIGLTDSYDASVFSTYTHEVICDDNKPKLEVSYIEPLAGALRHPFAGCLRGGHASRGNILKWKIAGQPKTNIHALEEKNYLLLHRQSSKRLSNGKLFIFDLGASTWSEGIGGSSQMWLWHNYRKCGYKVERMFLWESKVLATKDIYRNVPKEALFAYQYFNLPASADKDDPSNPLNIVKQVASREDFVAIKLDIDNAPVEMRFIDTILNDPELDGLVDEVFFEHHVAFPPFVKCCWSGVGEYDPSSSILTSYELFLKLRKKGIRMHGWP